MKTALMLAAVCLALPASSQNSAFAEESCAEGGLRLRVREFSVIGTYQIPQTSIDELRQRALERRLCVAGEAALEHPKELAQRVRMLWLQHGYFKATVWPVRLEWLRRGDTLELEASFRVDEGPQLTFGGIRWQGVTAFPEDELTALFPIYAGSIFNVEAIRRGLESVRKLYTEHGYLNMTAIPQADEAATTLLLLVEVDEGNQFRFGELATFGLDPPSASALRRSWAALQGQLYSSQSLWAFLSPHANDLPLEFRLKQDLAQSAIHVCIGTLPEQSRTRPPLVELVLGGWNQSADLASRCPPEFQHDMR